MRDVMLSQDCLYTPVERGAAHHIGVEIDDRRRHHSGHRSNCSGQLPAEADIRPGGTRAGAEYRDRVHRAAAHPQQSGRVDFQLHNQALSEPVPVRRVVRQQVYVIARSRAFSR